jgi:hypothetical protein
MPRITEGTVHRPFDADADSDRAVCLLVIPWTQQCVWYLNSNAIRLEHCSVCRVRPQKSVLGLVTVTSYNFIE